jgi:glutamate-1-semialdehyde aminotransferase
MDDRDDAGRYRESRALWQRACQVIAGGTNTNSKRVTVFGGPDRYPAYVKSARGARLTDIDGNEYLDFVAALAPVVLGYGVPSINAAIARQLEHVVLASLPPPCEVELALTLHSLLPQSEKVRFFKTGAEANSAGIRLARIATGRQMVVCSGYHGWHDWWAGLDFPAGIPKAERDLIKRFVWGDLEDARRVLEVLGRDVAAIIVTPALYGRNPPPGFLEGLRKLADETGALLIFDEIITGFRFALGGAAERYGVVPDASTYAKAIANGMPLAVLCGRDRLMQAIDETWITSTYSSEALSIAAAIETIELLKTTDAIPRLYSLAGMLDAGLARLGRDGPISILRGDVVPALTFRFDHPDASSLAVAFIAESAQRGVLFRREGGDGVSACMIAAMTDSDIEQACEVARAAIKAVCAL